MEQFNMSIVPHIRLAHPDDASAIQAIYAPVVMHTPISFETVVPTVEEMRQRVEQTLKTFPWLVYEDAGEVSGYAYASQHRVRAAYQWSVDVSVYVHERMRRQGIGRKLYMSLFELLRRQGFYNAFAGIALPNPASVALHEAMGMQAIGVYEKVGYKHGAWHDVGWWQGLLQAHSALPAPPRKLADIVPPDWEEAV
jgi:L-amino acid N-acyltransferase YncA